MTAGEVVTPERSYHPIVRHSWMSLSGI